MPKHPGKHNPFKRAMEHEDDGKIGVVMGEFKRGTLRSGSGKKVKSRKQAIAIAMSEAGKPRKKER